MVQELFRDLVIPAWVTAKKSFHANLMPSFPDGMALTTVVKG